MFAPGGCPVQTVRGPGTSKPRPAQVFEGLGSSDEAPTLAPGLDFTKLTLTAEEGFVLTRIDGTVTLGQLVQISGLGRDRTLEILRKLRELEVIETSFVACDLPLEVQERINKKHAGLRTVDLFDLLEIAVEADQRTIKKAYFLASKEFHPDRHYGKKLGPFKQKLEEIFKELTQAFEYLKVEKQRQEYAAQVGEVRAERKAEERAEGEARAAVEAERRERERVRLPGEGVRSNEDLQRQAARALRHYEAGQRHAAAGRWPAALTELRMAATFQPQNEEYQRQIKRAVRESRRQAAQKTVARGEMELGAGRFAVAAEIFEEAGLELEDVPLLERAAEAHHKAGELNRVRDLAIKVADLGPRSASVQHLLAGILRDEGKKAEAALAARRALGLEPGHEAAAKLLAELEAAQDHKK